jgi:nicotinate-nucleotide adenylyltransferase
VHLLDGVHEDVSATELRERLERGEDCGDVLPEGVMEYIRARGLYRG